MIISKTPLRISFVGGGSDLPGFYRAFGGAVVSTSVDKYVYVTVNKKFDERIRLSYSQTENVDSVDQIQHPLVRETMNMLSLRGGVEITSISDIPSRGTGMGTSSSFTVGLLHALHAYRHEYASPERLARESCEVELERCKEPIGKQDQYAAAYGGLNLIQFHRDESVSVDPIICSAETLAKVQSQMLCFYTGVTRSASGILKNQSELVRNDAEKERSQERMSKLAFELRDELQRNNPDSFGVILHENWSLKRSLTSEISSTAIDAWYERAMKAGATGGKLLGAGAGGFLMFCVAPDRQQAVIDALSDLRHVHFGFERGGSKIIFYN